MRQDGALLSTIFHPRAGRGGNDVNGMIEHETYRKISDEIGNFVVMLHK